MTNKFTIIITALDRATSTVRKVKSQFAKFTAPFTGVMRSVKSLGKELGLDRLARGLGSAARGAFALLRGVGGAALAIAGITSAATMAAVTALANRWADTGAAILRFSAVTGTATMKIQTLSGAAEIFGLKAEDMQAGIKAVGDTMEDALFGRNQEALMLMNRLHIRMKRTKDGAVDAADALYQIADAVSQIHNVQAQGVVARAFGVEQLLPLLQKGSKGIKEYEAQLRKTGAYLTGPQLAQAKHFQETIARLKLSTEGLGNSIMQRLTPSLDVWLNKMEGLVEKTSEVIRKHKELETLLGAGKAVKSSTADRIIGFGKSQPGSHPFLRYDPTPSSPQPLEYGWMNPFHWLGLLGMNPLDKTVRHTNKWGSTLGVRNNNPGNLRRWGTTPTYGGFARFPNAATGISAMVQNLIAKQTKYGFSTLAQIIGDPAHGWAPASDGNDVNAYLADIFKRTGFSPNRKLNLRDRTTLSKLTKAIIAHENRGYQYDTKVIDAAISERIGPPASQRNAPAAQQDSSHKVEVTVKAEPGTKAVITDKKGSGPAHVDARVEHSMVPVMSP